MFLSLARSLKGRPLSRAKDPAAPSLAACAGQPAFTADSGGELLQAFLLVDQHVVHECESTGSLRFVS
jgi:hypothetical protein